MTASNRSIAPLCSFVANKRNFPRSIVSLLLLWAVWSSLGFAQTTISGTVHMPNGTDVLPNVLVYATTGSVTTPISGATCTGSTPSNQPASCITAENANPTLVTSGTGVYAATYTAVNGTFTLTGVPINTTYSVVIEAGKWQRVFPEAVETSPLTGLSLSMPATHAEGNIPLIAVVTGSADALECVFRDLGLADTEFTDDNGTVNLGGRIHLYKGDKSAGAEINASTPSVTTLVGGSSTTPLNSYDMVMFPCQGVNSTETSSSIDPILAYTSAGGRVFATHWSEMWLNTAETYGGATFSGAVNWLTSAGSNPSDGAATVNTNFTDGSTLSQWLYLSGYSAGGTPGTADSGTEGQVAISTLRDNIESVIAPTQTWLTLNSPSDLMQFTFNTPLGAAVEAQYGRVVFNEYHVENVTGVGGDIFPAECPALVDNEIAQEKMLEYALFDLSNFVTGIEVPTVAIDITNSPTNFTEGDMSDTVTVNVTNTSSTVPLPGNTTLTVSLPAGVTATAITDTNGGWVCTVGTPSSCTRATGIGASASDSAVLTVSIAGDATGGSSSSTGSVSVVVASPNFSSNVTQSLSITLEQHAAVTWSTPAAITVGTPLSSTQLDAVGNTDGSYVYRLNSISGTVVSSGTLLPAGANTLWVIFTPSNQGTYPGTATASVTLTVNAETATASNPAQVGFGSEPVGSSSSQMVTFSFTGAGSIGAPVVVTQGATGLDFTDVGDGTCINGASYSASGTCTVDVHFAPRYPGPRNGAVLLEDGSGNVLATAYLAATGTGAQALFPPGTQTMLTPDTFTYWPLGVAVDSQFNLFFVDRNSNSYAGAIIEFPWQGSSYGAAQSPSSLNLPGGGYYATGAMVEDGAGNLYVGVQNYPLASILKYPWNGSAYGSAIWLGSGLVNPSGITVDGGGNLFLTDNSAQLIAELPWTGTGYGAQVTLADSSALGGGSAFPQGIAVDSSENVFFVASTSAPSGELMEIPYVSGSYSNSFTTIDNALYYPSGVTIDTNGNIYVADTNGPGTSTPVYEYVLTSGSYAARTQLFTTPYGGGANIALDAAGNLYRDWNSGDGGGAIYKQNRNVLPSITFPTTTAEGTADATDNPLSFALLNYGNADLTFASSVSNTNPAFTGGGGSFTLDGATNCPSLAASATPISLTPNNNCSYAIDFTPQTSGANSGSLVLTDNNQNVSSATQSISLSGTGTAPPISFTLPASTTLTAGTVASPYAGVTFVATGGTSPYTYAVVSGSLPAGMTLSAARILSGTPTAGGTFSFTVQATDHNSLSATQTYSLTIAAPTISVASASAILPGAAPGSPYSQTFTASGGTAPYSYSYTGTLPVGLTLSAAGVLSGTPTTAGGPYSFTIFATDSSTGSGPYTGSSITYSLIVGKTTAPVTLGNLAQTYTGSPLAATATTVPSGLTVILTYDGSTIAPTAPESYAVVATISDANYQGSTTGTLVISKATATVTLGNLTQTYTGSPLSATATTVPSGLTVTLTYNGSATAPTARGSYVVVATISSNDYTGSATGTMVIEPLTPAVSLASSTNPSIAQIAVAFTATVNGSLGTPTGTVSFLDGTTVIGTGTLSAGVATLTTAALSDGSHSITAVYNGDTNFLTATSAALTQSILDFSLTSGSGSGVTTQTTPPGGSATYPLNIVPTASIILPAPTILTVTGMPAGATAVITPSSWTQLTSNSWSLPANTLFPTMTLTIQVPGATANLMGEGPASRKLPPVEWGVLLLPFAIRLRRAGKLLGRTIFVLLVAAFAMGALTTLSGCSSGNGFFGQQQSSYPLTVTATSGPLTHSTTLTLNVE